MARLALVVIFTKFERSFSQARYRSPHERRVGVKRYTPSPRSARQISRVLVFLRLTFTENTDISHLCFAKNIPRLTRNVMFISHAVTDTVATRTSTSTGCTPRTKRTWSVSCTGPSAQCPTVWTDWLNTPPLTSRGARKGGCWGRTTLSLCWKIRETWTRHNASKPRAGRHAK